MSHKEHKIFIYEALIIINLGMCYINWFGSLLLVLIYCERVHSAILCPAVRVYFGIVISTCRHISFDEREQQMLFAHIQIGIDAPQSRSSHTTLFVSAIYI